MQNLERCIIDLNRRYDKGSLWPSEYLNALDRLKAMQAAEHEHELEMAKIAAMIPPKKTMADTINECGIPCTPAGCIVGPATVQYHLNLANLKDYSKLTRATNALGARLRTNVILSRSESADFAVTVPRAERATVPFKGVVETVAYSIRYAALLALL